MTFKSRGWWCSGSLSKAMRAKVSIHDDEGISCALDAKPHRKQQMNEVLVVIGLKVEHVRCRT